MKSYEYQHRSGIHEISWTRFAELSAELAELLAQQNVDMIIGIARAGLLPATAVTCMLRRELYPVRITRRFQDNVISETPVWKVDLPKNVVNGQMVAIVDEIADTGQTLSLVAERARKLGAKQVITSCLVSHTWANPKPDIVILESDELILFPWDCRVYQNGQWQMHPELLEAIRMQQERLE